MQHLCSSTSISLLELFLEAAVALVLSDLDEDKLKIFHFGPETDFYEFGEIYN